MNVKQWIADPVSDHFKTLDLRKHEAYRGGFEPIPDAIIFTPEIKGNWQRRSREATLRCMLLAIEIKASERNKGRLTSGEIVRDIRKLAAHREEVRNRPGRTVGDMHPVMMIVDMAEEGSNRMQTDALEASREEAEKLGVSLLYLSRAMESTVWQDGRAGVSVEDREDAQLAASRLRSGSARVTLEQLESELPNPG